MDKPASHKSVAHFLLDAAKQDEAACILLSIGLGIGDAVVGFHAQQAVEKSLKAVLSAHGLEFRRTHDLLTLLQLPNVKINCDSACSAMAQFTSRTPKPP
jgi:HEPN domain-containing protein